jgi:hypothetical protein
VTARASAAAAGSPSGHVCTAQCSPCLGLHPDTSRAAAAIAEAFTPDPFTGVLEAVGRRPVRAGQLVTVSDVHLRDDWAELLVQFAAFAHVRVSPDCRGYTHWSSGGAGCGCCGWGMSARMRDVGTTGSARFSQAAVARVGQAVALAVDELVQALFEAVLPWA